MAVCGRMEGLVYSVIPFNPGNKRLLKDDNHGFFTSEYLVSIVFKEYSISRIGESRDFHQLNSSCYLQCGFVSNVNLYRSIWLLAVLASFGF